MLAASMTASSKILSANASKGTASLSRAVTRQTEI